MILFVYNVFDILSSGEQSHVSYVSWKVSISTDDAYEVCLGGLLSLLL